ncbi:MAG TPA: hypothetical protein VK658_15770 [Chryseolinea sp.]|nr:hypothetical protein [Chryseolinea sp.]
MALNNENNHKNAFSTNFGTLQGAVRINFTRLTVGKDRQVVRWQWRGSSNLDFSDVRRLFSAVANSNYDYKVVDNIGGKNTIILQRIPMSKDEPEHNSFYLQEISRILALYPSALYVIASRKIGRWSPG